MNRSTMARRYAPLAALAAIQLLIIAVVPSKAPGPATEVAVGSESTGAPGEGEPLVEGTTEDTLVDGQPVDPATGQPTGGGTTASGGTRIGTGGATGGSTSGGGTTGGGGGGSTGGGETAATGDTSHCKDGRQYDPTIYYWAPKCVGNFTAKNPGATYQGVTDKEIKVVVYRGKPNEAVDAITKQLGANPVDADVTELMNKSFEFINEKYELYGRKIVWKEYRGSCDTVPPNYTCLRGEMRDLVRNEKPFLVVWNTILASPAFDELSALKVINVGGHHFRNSFSQQRRPYHWDVTIPGDVAAKHVAEWYCKRLHGKKAAFAGETGNNPSSQNPPTNDIRNKPRVLGVISTDDPENQNNIRSVLKPELAKCGATVAHEFYYAQDIARAEEQRRLGVAKMRENSNGGESTTIMCFCDAVAVVFLYRSAQEQSYFPEHVVVGTGLIDADKAGQGYQFGSSLCPDCHQFENAFGLRSAYKAESETDNRATRMYKMQGGKANINWPSYATAQIDLDYYMLVGNLLQGAGPTLTPGNVEKGAFAQGTRGGLPDTTDLRFNKRGFRPGNYGWNNDMDQVYWSESTVSNYNNKKGSYIQMDGRRFMPGEYPEGDLPMPAKPR